MPNRPLSLVCHHTKDELHSLWKASKNPLEKIKLRLLWKIRSEELSSTTLAMLPEQAVQSLGRSADWARRTIRAYNAEGIESVSDGRKLNQRPKMTSEAQVAELKEKVASGISADGGLWTGPKVAMYLSEIL